MYTKSFYITENSGNNAINFTERTNPKLFVPSLKKGTPEDLKITKEVTFESEDDLGKMHSCSGLESFIEFGFSPTQTAFIFDNHNHAFFFWHNFFLNKKNKQPYTLIHIDQHKDTRTPPSAPDLEKVSDPNYLFKYTNYVLNVGNFIPPAIQTGLIKDIIFIDSEQSIDNFKPITTPYILDIDIDFFCPDLDYIPFNKKMNLTKSLLKNSELITIATSPYFIDQNLAIETIKKIFN